MGVSVLMTGTRGKEGTLRRSDAGKGMDIWSLSAGAGTLASSM